MKIISWWRLARFSLLLLGTSAMVTATQAATYYVSPSGSDASSGTLTAPFATLQKAQGLANPGDTIYMRGGTYTVARTWINRSGSSGNPIKVFNYPGEAPILDAASMTGQYDEVVRLDSASWWHIKGLEIKNGPSVGIGLVGTASNIIVEFCNVHHNVRLANSGAGINVEFGSNNLILNNDSHHNGALATNGGDGIALGSQSSGNIIRGNRVWRNNDDGIDLWGAASVLVENNWSWENGYNEALAPSGGNGTGFKLGGGGTGDGTHTVRNNLAWRNFAHGFDDNSADNPMTLYNNTSYENGGVNFAFYTAVANVLKNNLSFPKSAVYIPATPVVQSNNSWNLGVTVDLADFMSPDFSSVAGPRNADGSLPASNFLKLVAGSELIDKGVNVGIAYSGSAPDLGAYEYAALPADTQAPTTPTTLTAVAVSSSEINLSWTASTDHVGVVGYNVYRDGMKIGTTASTTYSSTGLTAATTYSYSVTAFDAAGNTSPPSTSASGTSAAPPAPPPDTTPPTMSIASPTGGTVSNTILVTLNAADNVGVTRVDLRVNGVTVGSTNVVPYEFAWNSTTVSDGPVTLTAVAYDAAGNSTTSAAIALNVSNGPGLTSTLNPSTAGQVVGFTATVTGSSPTGSVDFTDFGAPVAGCSGIGLNGSGDSRTAVCNTSNLAIGTHSIVANYGGDAANAGSSSSALTQTVNAVAGSSNVALASVGAVASASSTYPAGYPVSAINNNERAGTNWGGGSGGWVDGTFNVWPDSVEIAFNGSKTIDRVVVYSVQDNIYAQPDEPTDSMTFSLYGVQDFTVEGRDGGSWVTLATVTNNNLVKRTVSFAPTTTDSIRLTITRSLSVWSLLTEVEAWGTGAALP